MVKMKKGDNPAGRFVVLDEVRAAGACQLYAKRWFQYARRGKITSEPLKRVRVTKEALRHVLLVYAKMQVEPSMGDLAAYVPATEAARDRELDAFWKDIVGTCPVDRRVPGAQCTCFERGIRWYFKRWFNQKISLRVTRADSFGPKVVSKLEFVD